MLEEISPGWEGLFQSVLLLTIRDLERPHTRDDARAFLESAAFDTLCGALEFDAARWRRLAFNGTRERGVVKLEELPGYKPYMGRRTPDEFREKCRLKAEIRNNARKRPCPGCGRGMYVKRCPVCAANAREERLKREGKRRRQY